MRLRHNKRISRAVVLLTFVSLACKFLIPVGYMPAAISDGWPVRMCHSGLPEGLYSQDDDQHHHSETDDERWENCSLGIALSAIGITSEFAFHLPYFDDDKIYFAFTQTTIDTTVVAFQSRAPPV